MLVVFQNTVWNRNKSSQKKQVRGYKKERGEEDTIRELPWKKSEWGSARAKEHRRRELKIIVKF